MSGKGCARQVRQRDRFGTVTYGVRSYHDDFSFRSNYL
jgi:hypothetical protein